jgi:uncharacterized protein (DUF1015 family)
MALIRPFRALRPQPELARKVAAPPYDVLNAEKAREIARDNPDSILYVTKPEINFEINTAVPKSEIYKKGAEYLHSLVRKGVLFQDPEPCFYIYQQTMHEHCQTGLVACASVDEYLHGKIKKHEHTQPEKVQDRFELIKTLEAQTGPIFLAYKYRDSIDAILREEIIKKPVYDFVYRDGVHNVLWKISDPAAIDKIRLEFQRVDSLYIADGHHRCEAATQTCLYRRSQNPAYNGSEEFNSFLSVIFADQYLQIYPYNRMIADLAGLSVFDFINKLSRCANVVKIDGHYSQPRRSKHIGMYLKGQWYELTFPAALYATLPNVDQLDAALLQNEILSSVLGLRDARNDKRIKFVGGAESIHRMCQAVDAGESAAAFSLFPVSMRDIIEAADHGGILPPKSTWFEPKLLSGLYTHLIK